MPVGDALLFEYSDEIMAHWGTDVRTAEYQIAALARDMLGSIAAAISRLPERVERLASSWTRLRDLQKRAGTDDENDQASYVAWRWLSERSPWTSYLLASPRIQFVRVGDENKNSLGQRRSDY